MYIQNPPSYSCNQCDNFLCDKCFEAHKKVKITRNHTLKLLKHSTTNRGRLLIEVDFYCKAHTKSVDYN